MNRLRPTHFLNYIIVLQYTAARKTQAFRHFQSTAPSNSLLQFLPGYTHAPPRVEGGHPPGSYTLSPISPAGRFNGRALRRGADDGPL